RDDVSALRIRVFTLAGMAVQLRRNTHEAFLAFLKQEKLVAIWALAGEKNVYGGNHNDGFGGRWTFTRIFHSHGDEIIALERYQSFDAPSPSQLAALKQTAESYA
uniref:hypothetical protein n=1 Tax=Aeromonas sp. QDB11 TaxID=2990482 RepID=UPI0022E5C815